MRKAKGLFAVAVILIVAGASGALWYLHDAGRLGGEKESEHRSIIWREDEDNAVEKDRNDTNDGKSDSVDVPIAVGTTNTNANDSETILAEHTTTNPGNLNTDENEIDHVSVNEFLSIFSRVYFAESQPYAGGSGSSYERIRFAYSHLRRTDKSVIVTKEEDDDVRYYNGVSIEDVNNVLEKYLGVSVGRESVYTENDYMFFKFEDGVFYTPATDGVGYTNLAVADTITADGERINVDFTIYSAGVDCTMTSETAEKTGEKYKSGSATLRITNHGYILDAYSVK